VTTKFPIVKIDRATMQELLPLVMHKGLFSNYNTLPEKAELLNAAKEKMGISVLTFEQERKILSNAGEYRTNNYVVRDYGDYAIGFTSRMFLDHLEEAEKNCKNTLCSDEDKRKIELALSRIKVYKLAHKLALIILSEAYEQGKFEELIISKQKILQYLNYSSDDKFIYQDISDAIFSLRWLDYQIFEYRTKTKVGEKAKTVGNFIYNIREDKTSYTFWVNRLFVGCIQHFFTDEKNDRSKFERGYITYPTAVLPMTRHYSAPAYLLFHFLICESGNSKLKEEGTKVVAHKLQKFIIESKINYTQPSKNVNAVLDAFDEVKIIEKIVPSPDELKAIKAEDALKTTVYISFPSRIKDLDKKIRSNLLVLKK
jgi:hypothetical protein